MTHARPVTVFVCGDVMTGRQIDQILPHHNPPGIQEPYVRDACDYVELAKPEELGVRLNPEQEMLETAELFNNLRMERSEHPLRPLCEGRWQ